MEYLIKIHNNGLSIYFIRIGNNRWYYFDSQIDLDNYFNEGVIPINNEVFDYEIKKILSGIIFDCIETGENNITIFSKSLYEKLVYLIHYENN